MKLRFFPLAITSVVFLVALALLSPLGVAVGANPVRHTNLANAKLGLFVHYVFGLTQAAPGRPPLKNVNEFANDLNVKGIADMASAMGAQYVIFTAYHWRMTMLFPCPFWSSAFPNHDSSRDVIKSLAQALKLRGIKLVLYIHPDDRHDFSRAMLDKLIKLGWSSRHTLKKCLLQHLEPHDRKWNRFFYRLLGYMGHLFGNQIAGYWIDDGDAAANGVKVRNIICHYTPHAAIWANGYKKSAPVTLIGGENWSLFDHNPKPHLYNTTAAQTAVVIAGSWWASGGQLQFTPAEMYRYLVCTIGTKGQRNGGVVYATSPFSDNHWEAGVPAGLAALGKLIKARAQSIYNTVPSRAYVSGDAAAQKPKWGVAVDSMDGKTVYLHILMPPKGRSLQIGKPADHVKFSGAHLLNGRSLRIESNRRGYTVVLPPEMKWNPVDTVIALTVK
jgi:uncharacterized membrane protein